MTNQLPYPLSTSAQALYPFQYIEEPADAFGVLITASPSYLPVKIAGDITPTRDGQEIEVGMSGSYYLYGLQSAGHDYSFTMDIMPTDIGLLKYGTDPVTNPQSLQFVRAYKRAIGTQALNTVYEYYLGCRINSVSLTVTGRDLVKASCEVLCRDITVESTASGLTTPVFTTFGSITGQVLSNVDADYLPFTYNGTPRPVSEFTIEWANNLSRVNMVGSEQGLTEQIQQGHIGVTGSWSEPIGRDLTMETASHNFPQAGVAAKFRYKAGNMVATIAGLKITSVDRPIPAQPTEPLQATYNWIASSATLGTT